MSRYVWVLHGQDVLDAAAEFSVCGRRAEGRLRRGVASHDAKHGVGSASSAERRRSAQSAAARPIQVPAPAAQSRPQNTRGEGPSVLGIIAGFLREEPEAGHPRYARACLQRHEYRCRRLRPHVLRPRVPDRDHVRGGAVQLHIPLVLRGQVQAVSHGEGSSHVFIDERCDDARKHREEQSGLVSCDSNSSVILFKSIRRGRGRVYNRSTFPLFRPM